MKTNEIANKIIKLFIDEQIPTSIQLDALKLAKLKIDFCRETSKKINQQNLF
jgi:hypothetical protein